MPTLENISTTFILGKVGNELLEQPVAMFEDDFDPKWLENELVRDIIKRIDNTCFNEGGALVSPVLGPMSHEMLSCGCKSVILAALHPDAEQYVFDGSKMGDNCYPVLFDVVNKTGRKLRIQVGRLLREPWGEDDVVVFMPTKDKVVGYEACYGYLSLHTHLFWKGDGYGTQG